MVPTTFPSAAFEFNPSSVGAIPPICGGTQRWYLRGRFQFHGACDPADGNAGSVVIATPEPLCGLVLRLLCRFRDVLNEPFVALRSNVARVLLWLFGLDKFDDDRPFLSLLHLKAADIFGATFNPNGCGFSAPLDGLVRAAHDTHGG